MSPRPDVSEERKEQITQAAANVFAQKGFHSARMDDIADEAKLSKGSLYQYFKNKDAIITHLLTIMLERELADLRNLQTDNRSAEVRLLELFDHLIKEMNKWFHLIPVIYEFLSMLFRRSVVQKAFKTYLRTYFDLITPIIQQGIQAGEFKATNAKDAAVTIGAIFEGTILLWVYDRDSVDLDYHLHSGINLLLKGLKA